MSVCVDDGKVALLENYESSDAIPFIARCAPTCVLNCDTEQDEMAKFYGMNGHVAALAQVAPPILIRILVVYAVLQIVRQQILKFERSPQPQVDLGILPILSLA